MAVHLITGDDESLLLAAVSDLVHRLVGDGDRSLMVDEFDDEDYEVGAVVDSAQTPPFLTEMRIVVARGVGRFNADEVAPLGDLSRRSVAQHRAGPGRRRRTAGEGTHRCGQEDGWLGHRHRAAGACP